MTPSRTIQATFWTMLVLQTLGSVDMPNSSASSKPRRKLPPPKAYVAVMVLWSIFNLAAETSFGALAARLSVLVVLVGAVVGPFGVKAVSFLEGVSQHFAISPAGSGSGPGSSQAPPAGGNRSGGRVI